ncbi:MAG: DUF3999 domain-containing protein [Azonexus sp.]|jgi:hypothetical protein|uniref:DUF3999 domain-containing protein n=1 Tax=Azonexus sp. TaxID=1872668 RepID=UPI00282015FF|nr:DUF3999 domain-containing protein [Azonexus sp.]MDR0777648.1 DUF3999 domain-containing protein [Azonexus sp.]
MKMMMKVWRCARLLLLSPLLAAAPGAVQAQTAAISLSGEGPYYRLALPLAIHSLATAGDLRDVRVVNAAGHTVPRAWLRDEATPVARVTAQDVAIFALPRHDDEGAAAADTAVVLMLKPDGALALRAQAPRPASNEAEQWIIDASQVKGSLLQVRFTLAPEARGVFPFFLEASDDLRQWRAIGGEEQLLRLEQGGQSIERLALDLGRVRARFLRLTWSDPQRTVPLAGVGIDSIEEFEPVAPLEWQPALKPEHCAADHCDYRLPRGLPLQSLRIDLADVNTLAPIRISGLRDQTQSAPQSNPVPLNPLYSLRHRRQAAKAADHTANEIPLLDTVVYRLTQNGHEIRSPALALDGRSHDRLRLRTQGNISALGATPPAIAVAGTPRTLVFLAQGQGPFALRWDQPAPDTAAPLALSALIPGYAPAKPLAAGQASVTLADAAPLIAPNAAPAPANAAGHDRKWWLWGTLAIGLLLLGGMAWSLLGNLRKAGGSEK